jgi:hypothetical protein
MPIPGPITVAEREEWTGGCQSQPNNILGNEK